MPATRIRRRRARRAAPPAAKPLRFPKLPILTLAAMIAVPMAWWFHQEYTLSLQSPVRLRFQSPFVVARRMITDSAAAAQADQHGRRLSAWQQYACRKFGSDCRLALAVQRAENSQGKCEIYHYNSDGTLDWGYFQINTVHLKRPGVNLRDLLDCRANIDFAYELYREKGGFTPWSTFNSGAYRQFMTP
ncbi:MAG TPA: hypothetical protein VFA04_23775 [Bryobacteraceae bacterium]|nr:hypothetical protein [Bryobacteraceae bacterium]